MLSVTRPPARWRASHGLASLHRPAEVDGANETSLVIDKGWSGGGHHRCRCKIVVRAARKHNDLEAARLFREQRAKPVHAVLIALNQLVVEDDNGLQVLSEAEPIQRGQLLTGAD